MANQFNTGDQATMRTDVGSDTAPTQTAGAFTAEGDTVQLTTSRRGLVGVNVSGTWVGTIVAEISLDGTNWTQVDLFRITDETVTETITTNGLYRALYTCVAIQARFRASAWTTGTANIACFQGGTGRDFVKVYVLNQGVGGGDASAANQVLEIAELNALNVAIGAITTPADVQPISGNVEIANDSGNPISVSGTVTVNQGTAGAQRWLADVVPPSPSATLYLPVRLTDGSSFYTATGGGATIPPTYSAVFDRIVPAANKYMATLFCTSATSKVCIRRIFRFNWQVAAVTGVLLEQYMALISARTVGTTVAIRANDTSDSLSAGIAADTNSSAVTETFTYRRCFALSEECVLAATGLNLGMAADQKFQTIYEAPVGGKPLTLRNNQGLTIRNVTNSTVGSVSYVIEFTDEAA